MGRQTLVTVESGSPLSVPCRACGSPIAVPCKGVENGTREFHKLRALEIVAWDAFNDLIAEARQVNGDDFAKAYRDTLRARLS